MSEFTYEKMRILLSLYDVIGEHPLCDIISRTGLNNKRLYNRELQDWFVSVGVLLPNGTAIVRAGKGEKRVRSFIVDHKRIDQLLCTVFPTRRIYDRVIGGKISVFPRLKPPHLK